MVIGICDDDRVWCRTARELILSYGNKISEDFQVRCFEDSESLLAYEGDAFDVLFMDIELEEGGSGEGIGVAGLINGKWKECRIVYLTNYLYYATEVYGTKHIFFVLKEKFGERISEVFDKIFHELSQSSEKCTFNTKGGGTVSFYPSDIMYFERCKRETRLITRYGIFEIWEKIGEISERLPQLDFLRCHNSFIVYIPFIRVMSGDFILTENGDNIPISRSYRKNAKRAFSRWAVTQMS